MKRGRQLRWLYSCFGSTGPAAIYGEAFDTVKNMMICRHDAHWNVRPRSFMASLQAGQRGDVRSWVPETDSSSNGDGLFSRL
jgi:hypothetical protein